MTDTELVALAKAGDGAAFGQLVDRHGSAVYRASLAVLGSPAEAEDVAQEALVQAFRKIADFNEDSAFKTWVVTIAWRRALNQRRGILRRLRVFGTAPQDSWPEPSSETVSAEDALIATEMHRDARQLIRLLPSRLRDPLLLVATGEYSYDELAVILGRPSGTVKWRVAEARRVLKRKLTRMGY